MFPDLNGPLTIPEARDLSANIARGGSVDKLAKQFGRTKTTIYRVINEMRAARIMRDAAGPYFQHGFRRKGIEHGFWAECPNRMPRLKKARRPAGLPPYLARCTRMPLLNREQEAHSVPQVQLLEVQGAQAARAARSGSAEVELDGSKSRSCINRPWRVKNEIVQANLRLVVSIAKRHVTARREFLRAGERRQHVADPGGREVRLRSRQQVQHVRELGDHEELRPDDSGRVQASRPFPHSQDEMFQATEDARGDQLEQESARISAKRRSSEILVAA